MEIKQFGKMSEVRNDGKVVFVGSMEECERYCDANDVIGYDENKNPVCRDELSKWFGFVQNRSNWKMPIRHIAPNVTEHERYMISMAIEFFTGSVAEWSQIKGEWMVEAEGYYAACGA